DQGITYDHLTQGTGSVNPAGAIDLAAHIDPTMAVSSWWLTTVVNTWTLIDNQTQPWAQDIIWRDSVGDGQVVFVNEPAWAQHIVWGSNIVWENTLIGVSDVTVVTWGMAADVPSLTTWRSLDGAAESTGSIVIATELS